MTPEEKRKFIAKQKSRDLFDEFLEIGEYDFESKYGANAISTITEYFKRQNQETWDNRIDDEEAATDAIFQLASSQANNPSGGLTYNKNAAKNNPLHERAGKGSVRGTALVWNGLVDLVREGVDPLNLAKPLDWVYNRMQGYPAFRYDKRKDPIEKYLANARRRALTTGNPDGALEAWTYATANPRDFLRLDVARPNNNSPDRWKHHYWLKMVDKEQGSLSPDGHVILPFEGQELGKIGNFAEILAMEMASIGTLGLARVLRAKKYVRYFGDKAAGIKEARTGAATMVKSLVESGTKYDDAVLQVAKVKKMSRGEVEDIARKGLVIDKNGNIVKRTTKEQMEALEKSTVTTREIRKKVSAEQGAKEAEKMIKNVDLYTTEGLWMKALPAGAFAEAETYAMLASATMGMTAQEVLGRWASVIGEIGGGLMGPRLIGGTVRYGGDWINAMRWKSSDTLDNAEKTNAFLRGIGFKEKEILNMPDSVKASYSRMATTFPSVGLGVFKKAERTKLREFRRLADEIDKLPREMREDIKLQLEVMHEMLSKYDDGSGRVFAMLSHSLNLSALQTIESRVMGRANVGKLPGITNLLRDPNKLEMQKRIAEQSNALNEILMEYGAQQYGDSRFGSLLRAFKKQVNDNYERLQGYNHNEVNKIIDANVTKLKIETQQIDNAASELLESRAFDLDEAGFLRLEDPDKPGTFLKRINYNEIPSFVQGADTTNMKDLFAKNGVVRYAFKDVNGNNRSILLVDRGLPDDASLNKFGTASEKLINKVSKLDFDEGHRMYDEIPGYKDNVPLNENMSNEIAADFGARLYKLMDDDPDSARRLAGLGTPEMKFYDELVDLRAKGLTTKFGSGEQIDIDALSVYAQDVLGKGPDEIAEVLQTDGPQKLMDALAMYTGKQLPEINLQISLKDLVRWRQGLYKGANNALNATNKTNAWLNMELADSITDSLKKFAGEGGDEAAIAWKKANDNWYKTIGSVWRRGIAKKLIARSRSGDKVTGSANLFDVFMDAKDPIESKRLFNTIFDDAGDLKTAKKLLNESLINKLEINKKPKDGWFQEFADVLGHKLDDPETTEYGRKVSGQIAAGSFSTNKETITRIRTVLEPVFRRLELDVKHAGTQMKKGVDDALTKDLGNVDIENLKQLKGITKEDDFRQAIMDSTYGGGNTDLTSAVAKIIKDSGDKVAMQGFERMLYDGAMEALFANSGRQGIQIGEIGAKGKKGFKGIMDMKIDVFEEYMDSNKNILKKFMGKNPITGQNRFEELEELRSLLNVVVGDITPATVDQLPRQFRVEQIISRMYSIARGVVSPRYVLTELLIQDVRFRKGRMLEQMATDPEASYLLATVIFDKGLLKPSIRKDFLKWWIKPMIRGGRGDAEGLPQFANRFGGQGEWETPYKDWMPYFESQERAKQIFSDYTNSDSKSFYDNEGGNRSLQANEGIGINQQRLKNQPGRNRIV